LAAGGRYDWLIQQFRHPVIVSGKGRGRQPIHGVGVNIAMQKIVFALENYQAAILKMIQSKKIEEDKSFWIPKTVYIIYGGFFLILLLIVNIFFSLV